MPDGAVGLAIDSNWDVNTASASSYRRANVHSYLNGRNITVKELSGSNANAIDAKAAAATPGVVYITGVSHGRNDAFTGQDEDPIFDTRPYDASVFGGKIVHFLACNTAYLLGPSLVRDGATAFFGYVGAFAWPDSHTTDYAELFFDCDADIDRGLADGMTAGAAAQKALAKFDATIAKLRSGNSASIYAASVLQTNRDMLRTPLHGRAFGNKDATLTPLTPPLR